MQNLIDEFFPDRFSRLLLFRQLLSQAKYPRNANHELVAGHEAVLETFLHGLEVARSARHRQVVARRGDPRRIRCGVSALVRMRISMESSVLAREIIKSFILHCKAKGLGDKTVAIYELHFSAIPVYG